MYKEILISIIIVLVITIGDYMTQGYTDKSMTELQKELSSFETKVKENLYQEEKRQELEQDLKNIHQNWDEMYQILAYFIEHDELEKVETELTDIKGKIEVGLNEESIAEIQKCNFILEHIKDKERLMIQNIF